MVILLTIGWFYWKNIQKTDVSKGWRLTIYERIEHPNSRIITGFEPIQTIEGYESSLKCQEKGVSLVKENQTYECGLDCEKLGTICKKLCGPSGCT